MVLNAAHKETYGILRKNRNFDRSIDLSGTIVIYMAHTEVLGLSNSCMVMVCHQQVSMHIQDCMNGLV